MAESPKIGRLFLPFLVVDTGKNKFMPSSYSFQIAGAFCFSEPRRRELESKLGPTTIEVLSCFYYPFWLVRKDGRECFIDAYGLFTKTVSLGTGIDTRSVKGKIEEVISADRKELIKRLKETSEELRKAPVRTVEIRGIVLDDELSPRLYALCEVAGEKAREEAILPGGIPLEMAYSNLDDVRSLEDRMVSEIEELNALLESLKEMENRRYDMEFEKIPELSRARFESIESKKKELADRYRQLYEARKKELEEVENTVGKELRELEAKEKQLKAERSQLRNKIEELKRKKAKLKKRADEIRAAIASLESREASARRNIEESRRRIEAYRKEMEKLKKAGQKTDYQERQIAQLEARIKQLSSDIEKFSGIKAAYWKELKDVEAELERVGPELELCEKRLEETRRELVRDLPRRLIAVRKEYAKRVNEVKRKYDAKLYALHGEIAKLDESLKKLEDERKKKVKELSQAFEELKSVLLTFVEQRRKLLDFVKISVRDCAQEESLRVYIPFFYVKFKGKKGEIEEIIPPLVLRETPSGLVAEPVSARLDALLSSETLSKLPPVLEYLRKKAPDLNLLSMEGADKAIKKGIDSLEHMGWLVASVAKEFRKAVDRAFKAK